MCSWCEETEDGVMYCQDCGKMICFDYEGVDDVTAPAYVTASGDLFCLPCGSRYDREEEESYDEDDYGWEEYPASWYDSKSNLDQLEDADTPRYIDITNQIADEEQ